MEHLSLENGTAIEFDWDQCKDLWLISSLAIVTISLCGMMGLFLVPLVQKVCILQFLVSLAIGTLFGDAFLHLLPHAMITDHSQMQSSLWKGTAALLSLLVFYVVERLVNIFGEWKKNQDQDLKIGHQARIKSIKNELGIPTVGK